MLRLPFFALALLLAICVPALGHDVESVLPEAVLNHTPKSDRFGELLGKLMRQTCAGRNGNCQMKADCCGTRFCNRRGKCRRCRVKGDNCSFDDMCCLDNVCTNNRCRAPPVVAPPPACKPVGSNCAAGSECCSTLCSPAGKCVCRRRGRSCASSTQCCDVNNPKKLRCFLNRCVGCTDGTLPCSKRRPCCGGGPCMGGICITVSVAPLPA